MPEPKVGNVDGQPIHYSVGAIISQGEKVLMIDRANFPLGFACPAGHIDVGESEDTAVAREVAEETGLKVVSSKLVAEEFVPWNECNYGTHGHYWYVFRCRAEGQLKKSDSEFKSIGWHDVNEVKNFEPVWEHWFKKLTML